MIKTKLLVKLYQGVNEEHALSVKHYNKLLKGETAAERRQERQLYRCHRDKCMAYRDLIEQIESGYLNDIFEE